MPLTSENAVSARFDFPQGVPVRMPRARDHQAQRSLWLGAGDAWNAAVDLLVATGVWAAIGYGLDRWLGTWPVLFFIGAAVGHGTGIYILYRRWQHMNERAQRGARRDQTR